MIVTRRRPLLAHISMQALKCPRPRPVCHDAFRRVGYTVLSTRVDILSLRIEASKGTKSRESYREKIGGQYRCALHLRFSGFQPERFRGVELECWRIGSLSWGSPFERRNPFNDSFVPPGYHAGPVCSRRLGRHACRLRRRFRSVTRPLC